MPSKKLIYTLAHQNKYLHARKLILLLINNIYVEFSCLEMQNLDFSCLDSYRPKYAKMFLLCLKRKDSQVLKSCSCKSFYPQCVCYWCNLLRSIFPPPCDNWNTSFSIKRFSVVSFTTMLLLSLKLVLWKTFIFDTFSPQ